MPKPKAYPRIRVDFILTLPQWGDYDATISAVPDYDPGCWRTRNGDGWPPTLEFEDLVVENMFDILCLIRRDHPPTAKLEDKAIEAIVNAEVDRAFENGTLFDTFQKAFEEKRT